MKEWGIDPDEGKSDEKAPEPVLDPKLTQSSPFLATRYLKAMHLVFEPSVHDIRFKTRLNVDMTRESVRGVVSLPHGVSRGIEGMMYYRT